MSVVAATTGFANAPLWFTTRSTAIIAFVLLTVTTVLGMVSTQRRLATKTWPRFASQALHRNVSLLALAFMGVHIFTTLVDRYVHVGWWSLIVPFASPYKTFWVSLGTLAFDLVLVVTGTSLLRQRLSARSWRAVHLSTYALWPLALWHFLGTGTDAAHGRWGLWLGLGSLITVAGAAMARLVSRNEPHRVRSVAARSR